ncbi:unnamed protein product [Caenorhabditis angaria]|uniref:Uncharacterized protein n=1 Tax=Caenorhabditis angaria TaxID=860376 RepID=A0A9P1N2C0_9PELO|nr:unnamed protein product [Caenorhabditis angaria]
MRYFDEATTEIAVILLIIGAGLVCLVVCMLYLLKCRRGKKGSSSRPPILSVITPIDGPECHNDAFECIDETSAKRIEERRRARQQSMQMQNSPKADLTLRKIDPEIGKALAVEQLMRNSLVFDTIPRPPKSRVEIVAAKRDYL